MSKGLLQARFKIGETMLIRPLSPRLRRAMLDAAKAKEPSDDLIMLLNEAELVFVAEVPAHGSKGSRGNVAPSVFYSPIASEVLNRLHDCFLLFAWVPAPLLVPCWFCAEASAKYATITQVEPLNPGWKCIDEPTNLDWRSASVEPVDVGFPYFGISSYWPKLSRLCQIDQLEKISNRLHTNPSKNRLARGFQFFSQSLRLVEPHRFVGFATCLETLFCTRRTEMTFHLASRLSWLLEPKDYSRRRETFKEASDLYDLRSKIVHGTDFSIADINTEEERMVDLCRRAFWKILSDDALFDTFFNRDPKVCDDFLESLNLGYPQAGNG